MNSEPRGRVLCLTSSFPRWEGDSTTPFVLHLAQDLQALGWSVEVLAPHAPDAAVQEILGGVHVERFRYFWPEALETVCYRGGALANLRRRPLDKLKLPMLVLCEWAALAERLGRGTYDLLHSHWILPQGFTGVLAAGSRQVPHVATVHGSDVLALNGPVIDRFKEFVLRRADIVTVNSSATRQAAARLVPEIGNLRTIPIGASATRAPEPSGVSALRERYRREPGPLLVFAGRIVVEKGIEDFISAIRLLVPDLPGVTALIVGDGPERAASEAAARQAGLGNRIRFAGWVAPQEMPDYLAAGDIFVAPSRFEAQGLVLLEAMLAGTPVVAADVGGVGDTVRHGITGLLVPARSPAEITAAVGTLHRDSGLAGRLSAAGMAYARTHGTRARTAEAFSGLFDGALARRAAHRSRTTHVHRHREKTT